MKGKLKRIRFNKEGTLVHKERGDFFYYEKAPEQAKLLVNGMNLDGLAEFYKITKDRRI